MRQQGSNFYRHRRLHGETSGENELKFSRQAGHLFTYHDDNGELTGLDVELGKALAEKLGVEVEFQECRCSSLTPAALIRSSTASADERAEKYDFSDPYYYEARCVVCRSSEDLNGFSLARRTVPT